PKIRVGARIAAPPSPEVNESMTRWLAVVDPNSSVACTKAIRSRQAAGKRNGRKNDRKLHASRRSSQNVAGLIFGPSIQSWINCSASHPIRPVSSSPNPCSQTSRPAPTVLRSAARVPSQPEATAPDRPTATWQEERSQPAQRNSSRNRSFSFHQAKAGQNTDP